MFANYLIVSEANRTWKHLPHTLHLRLIAVFVVFLLLLLYQYDRNKANHMKRNNKLVIKYCAFNVITHEFYLCTSKKDMAIKVNTSVDTIRRRESSNNDFTINNWCISVDVELHKQPKRNDNGFKEKS